MSRVSALLDNFVSMCVAAAAIGVVWNVVTAKDARPTQPSVLDDASARHIQDIEDVSLSVEASAMRERIAAKPGSVALIEFSDFEYPFCGVFAARTLKNVKKERIGSGAVGYAFLNFPLERIHPAAFQAARIAKCARRQKRFWPVHHQLFDNQRLLTTTPVEAYVETSRLNAGMFKDCLAGTADDVIKADVETGRKLSVNSTPTLFVGTVQADRSVRLHRKILGTLTYKDLNRVLDEVSKRANSGV